MKPQFFKLVRLLSLLAGPRSRCCLVAVAVLTWEGNPGIKLQKSTSLTNPNWQDVPGTTGQSLAILPQADAAFFRLVQPTLTP
jgi:hypothetical protein